MLRGYGIWFNTNLDLAKPFLNQCEWIGPVPHKGEQIEFNLTGKKKFRLSVVGVTYSERGDVEVELHMGDATPCQSIREWEEWFKRHSRG